MNPVTLGNKAAPHLYRIGIEATTVESENEDLTWDEVITHVEVHARTRWQAMDIAERAGYVVRDCNLIG